MIGTLLTLANQAATALKRLDTISETNPRFPFTYPQKGLLC